MGSLPEDRVNPAGRPFSYVGVDCFGPIDVRRRRGVVKRYGVFRNILFWHHNLQLDKDKRIKMPASLLRIERCELHRNKRAHISQRQGFFKRIQS